MAQKITRRQVLTGAALAAATGATVGLQQGLSALESVAIGPRNAQTGGDALVVLFLRGGADGLNIVVPHGEDNYYRLRPALGIARPNDQRVAKANRALDLNGFFGLNPALEPLYPLFKEGQCAAVHAVGSGDQTRSHFEAMATMERGLAQETGAASGWLARHLMSTATETQSPLRAVAVSETMPDTLRGATSAVALTSLADFRLLSPAMLPMDGSGNRQHIGEERSPQLMETLRGLYGTTAEQGQMASLRNAGKETLNALEAVKRLNPANYAPSPGATYPKDSVGNAFRQVACLIKGEVGMEVAFLDMGGWDTHYGQETSVGQLPVRLTALSHSLAAFVTDLGPHFANTTILVMTEFGRRAYENFSLGTDHGRASCMFVLGGGILGGKVYGEWPGLGKEQLEEPGDLRVTTDYRDILSELLVKRVKNPKIADVFPEYTPRFRNITRAV